MATEKSTNYTRRHKCQIQGKRNFLNFTCFPRLKKIVKTENKEHIQIAVIILEDMHFLINITIINNFVGIEN